VPAELAGLRLDHFIKAQIPRLSRTKIQDIITHQLSRERGNNSVKPATAVVAGERYVIRRPARAEPPCPRTFTVVHADSRVLVVDKPAFLPVHASAKFYFNTLARVLAERYPDDDLALCHRLDRETSGCLAVARDREATAFVQAAIADKTCTDKQYLAVVHGVPPWTEQATLDTPLRLSTRADATLVPTVRVLPDPRGLASTTRVRVVRTSADGRYALVACTLVTGRQHQIRVHLAHAGFPIVGDKLYAHGDAAFVAFCERGLTAELAARFVLPRHALHAARLRFPHPDGGFVDAAAELPAELAQLVR
jgi:23S rRNA pseudouridine1911/1915/1917 synthase